jgi:hypothetical protein
MGVAVGIPEQEPNDDFDTAQDVTEGEVDGSIDNGESDFYRIELNSTDAIDLEISGTQDANLVLYDSDRDQLVSDSFREREITLKAPETGTYFVEVVGQDQQTTTDYTLNVSKITPEENDQFAPNDDFGSAAEIPEGPNDARIVGGESDFYRLEANSTDAINLEIDGTQDANLILYDEDRDQLVSDSFREREITLKAPETGTYFVEVVGQDQQTTTGYTLRVDKITPEENDQFAPNDDFSSAAVIPEGFNDARIVGGESDFYRLEANTTDAINLEIDGTQDANLILYDQDRNQLVSDSFREREITLKAPETGTYFVEVVGQDQQTTTDYTLGVDKITPEENDQFAPNDDFSSAAVLEEEFSDARVVGGESDFYRVGLESGQAIRLEVRDTNDVNLRLYNPDRTEVKSDTFRTREFGYEAQESGTYFIEVSGQDQQTTTDYQLQTNQTGLLDDGGQVAFLRVTTDAPASIAPGETASMDVSVTNTDVSNAQGGSIELTNVPSPLSVSGDSTVFLGVGGNTVPSIGETTTQSFELTVADDATTGQDVTVDISAQLENQQSSSTATNSTTITIAQRDRFDTNGQEGIQTGEVVDAIVAFNANQELGGQPVTRGDVVDLIVRFNA